MSFFSRDDDEDDHGKEREKPKHEDVSHSGTVMRALRGPKGEVRGALFDGGVTIPFPEHEADGVMDLNTPGAFIAVQGRALETPFGAVIGVKEMGPPFRTCTASNTRSRNATKTNTMTRSELAERTLVESQVAKEDALSKTRNGTVIIVVHLATSPIRSGHARRGGASR